MDILDRKENKLMKREELLVSLSHGKMATPKREEFLALAAKEAKASADVIIIDKVYTEKGRAASRARVFVYKSKEDIPKAQSEKKAKRLLGGKKSAAAEGKAA